MSKMAYILGKKFRFSLTLEPAVYYAMDAARGKIPATTYCNMIMQELFAAEYAAQDDEQNNKGVSKETIENKTD